jgi:glycosyltransferase involved in cell wall biosynthesis
MIRVGFIGAVSKDWMGGLNYYKNLLFALSTLEDKEIEVIVFVGENTDIEIKELFGQYAQVIEHPMFDKQSFGWYLWKTLFKVFKSTYFINKICMKYKIDVLSHSGLTKVGRIKTINWIPDFQYLHLPEMFSAKELLTLNINFKNLIKNSDAIILSSFDALKDFNNLMPKYSVKANVLQFVSQPYKSYSLLNNKQEIVDKYNLPKEFFYLPNQFWKHKNHLLVFEAVKLLVDENININVVCTGSLNDYRNLDYIANIQLFIAKNKLQNNIKLLGLIDYADVFSLIKYSKAVINPSLFEGWSSTVEECKSVSKNMILSNIEVHKEQSAKSLFFEKDNVYLLANILKDYDENQWTNLDINDLSKRTKEFAKRYEKIVLELTSND